MSHDRRTHNAEGAPQAIGPYSHAVSSAGLLFCSGQIALHPRTGELIGADAATQASRCLANLEAVCGEAGVRLADAVRCTIYMADLSAFPEVNDAYAAYFPDEPPARVAVGVSALPKGALVEIDAIVPAAG